MVERLSLDDQSLILGYHSHIIRYEFAAPACRNASVLDAGCGVGYGSALLRRHGAHSVLGVDISEPALSEARAQFSLPGLSFVKGDVERLGEVVGDSRFAVITNFENIEHLRNPQAFLSGASRLLDANGVLFVSTPNVLHSPPAVNGRPENKFHEREYSLMEFRELLAGHFRSIELFGQWRTFAGRVRQLAARRLFQQQCEAYYNPMARCGRVLKRFVGRPSAAPPDYLGDSESLPGDYSISPIEVPPCPWQPEVFLARCSNPAVGL